MEFGRNPRKFQRKEFPLSSVLKNKPRKNPAIADGKQTDEGGISSETSVDIYSDGTTVQ